MPRTVVKLCRNGGKDSVTKAGRCLKVQVRVRSGTMTVWESEMQGAFLVEPDSCFNTIHNHHGCIIPTIYITSRHLKPTQSGRQLYYDILYITGYPVWGGDFTCVTWQLRRPFFEKRVVAAHEEINKRRKMRRLGVIRNPTLELRQQDNHQPHNSFYCGDVVHWFLQLKRKTQKLACLANISLFVAGDSEKFLE